MKQIEESKEMIIVELQKNSKNSIDNIAKNCGFSRQKVWRFIKKLEGDNTIWGYTAIIDEESQDLKNYVILIKKTNLPMNEELLDNITNLVPNMKVRIEDCLYAHGNFDWIISFTAKNIKDAKRFCEILNRECNGYIADLQLLEIMFPVKRQGILNPEVKRLKEFF